MTNRRTAHLLLLSAALSAPSATQANETNKWTVDVSLYGLAAGMSGKIGVGRVNAPVDFGFDKVWDNLEFAMMGKVRLGYDRFKYDMLNQGPQIGLTFRF